MENHNLILKISQLFPSSFSSCHFRTLPDVADSSIPIPKTQNILHENDPNKPKKITRKPGLVSSETEGRKCPPVTPMSTLNPKVKKDIFSQKCSKNAVSMVMNQSSSSNSGWFSSSDEKTDTFFSLSSNSGDSFRRKSFSRRFRKCEEMKSIDENGRSCSFSSLASYDTVFSKQSTKTSKTSAKSKAAKKEIENGQKCSRLLHEPAASDHISADQLYYSKKSSKTRRKTKKNPSRRRVFNSSMIGESYAVEKRSSDPRSDFRASMVEMIVEKQMFGAQDLEKLLSCFLSLNSVSYHGIIFDVFSEICETLFTN